MKAALPPPSGASDKKGWLSSHKGTGPASWSWREVALPPLAGGGSGGGSSTGPVTPTVPDFLPPPNRLNSQSLPVVAARRKPTSMSGVHMRRSIRRLMVLAVLSCVVPVLLAGCGARKGSPTIQVTVTAAADCNNWWRWRGVRAQVPRLPCRGLRRGARCSTRAFPGVSTSSRRANIPSRPRKISSSRCEQDRRHPARSHATARDRGQLLQEGGRDPVRGASAREEGGPLLVTAGPTGLHGHPRK